MAAPLPRTSTLDFLRHEGPGEGGGMGVVRIIKAY